jgi:hypothetical protein
MPSISRVNDGISSGKPVFVTRPASAHPGIIAMEAGSFTRARNAKGLRWTTVPRLGRTAGAVVALPQGQPATSPRDGVALDYDVDVTHGGPGMLTLYLAPTLDTIGEAGVAIGVSLDDGPVTTLRAALEATGGAQDTPGKQRWASAVCDNVVRLAADLGTVSPGKHRISIWRLDDNVVLQKLVLSTVPLPDSYLGPSTALPKNI